MTDIEALIAAVKNPDDFRLEAYYYSFGPTGVIEIDRILSAVARAGKAFHNTEQWDEEAYGKWTPVDLIQAAANEAAKALEGLVSPTPTGDERERLGEVIWRTSRADEGTISATGANIIADAILAAFPGFRVTPEPVYEYRRVDREGQVIFRAEFSSMPLLDDGWSAERRAVGKWERLPVVSTSKEHDDDASYQAACGSWDCLAPECKPKGI